MNDLPQKFARTQELNHKVSELFQQRVKGAQGRLQAPARTLHE